MYIEEIILEGFKSYATRTVIPAWDPKFNAITGLNGSGKSNILDAICFVLGIDNLKQVRATSMQDLIYKRGQSGITKASVTLVFNNSDPEQCPIGYADHPQITVTRQIVVGGKNKYLVNGHNATNKVVENLFQSVQLNVNNPHFLIMQGQITKVLNMKPPEILALIEETAGTRMFEDRRGKALNTMEKKDKKMEEIEGLRQEIIEPKLATLRQERLQFMEFKRSEAEIDNLRKTLIAFDFFSKSQNLGKLQESLENLGAEKIKCGEDEAQFKENIKGIERELNELKKQKTYASEGDKIKAFEEAAREATNATTRIETQLELQKSLLAGALKDSEKLNKSSRKDQKSKEDLEKKISDLQGKLEGFRKEHDRVAAEVKQTEELLQSLETGVAISEDGHAETGYGKLLRELRTKLSECNLAIKDSELKISSIDEELQGINPKVAKSTKESQATIQKLENLQSEIESLQSGIAKSEEESKEVKLRFDSLQIRRQELEKQASQCRDVIEQCRGKVSHISFRYSDPIPNFDRNQVKGLVAELIRMDSNVAKKYSSALEIAAGGRLYNVVVESDLVAGQLLDKGKLQKRVTIIPLNKIVPKVIGADKVKRAQNLAPGRVHPALELVGSAAEVEQAIKYVFGGTFICDDSEAANAVAFDASVSSRAVTIDGDVYEPSGTLTGGSRQSSGSAVLESLSKFKEAQDRLAAVEDELKVVKDEISGLQGSLEALLLKQEKLALLQHELSMLQRQFEQNAQGKLLARKSRLDKEKEDLQAGLKDRLEEKNNFEEAIRQAQKEADDFAANRGDKLKSLKASLTRAKSSLQKESERLSKAEKEVDMNAADLNALNEQISRAALSIDEQVERRKECENLIQNLESDLDEGKVLQQKAESELESARLHLLRFDHEITALTQQKSNQSAQIERLQLLRAQISADTERIRNEISGIEKELKDSIKKNEWIIDNQKNFGVEGGSFDFGKLDIGEEKKKLAQLEERQAILKRNVNVNVLDMIDRVEARDNALEEMLRTVKKDKEKISNTIEALDDIKKETLLKTWRQVNEDFGAIFSDLLPGAFCKLDSLNEESIVESNGPIMKGLEIKVKLGGVWKESLTELSGGQRSLTALALILSLLKYRPAPFYILDEVDAALDLSHTQNIGNLLKKRFQSSQFIVVSLKEGMFTNANVLFKTKFKDGISSVERFEQCEENFNENVNDNENANENENDIKSKNASTTSSTKRVPLSKPQITKKSVKFN